MVDNLNEYKEMLKEMNVLVVDDASPMRDVVKYILGKAGIKNFFEASNGNEAITLLQSGDINLVIADWKMPSMNGLELIEKIRADDNLKTLPVIMVTGEGDKSHVIEAIKAGVSDYLVKPISAGILLRKVIKYAMQTKMKPTTP